MKSNDDRRHSVYMHKSPDGKVYIGCTGDDPKDRWGRRYPHNTEFTKDIDSIGWDNFEHTIIKSNMSSEEAYKLEQELIGEYRANDPTYGYNKTIGGKINTGLVRTPEYRKALSDRTKGEKHPFYGKKFTDEHRKKISVANAGHVVTDETRRKISETRKQRMDSYGIKRKVLCVETGIIYNSIKDAADAIGTPATNIQSACCGKSKTAGGYTWSYASNDRKD